ncbi:MAG: isoprenyl transferase [Anaeroplasmataceae bacterium]
MKRGHKMSQELDMNNIPKHIAIILDGNGRWAKSRLKPRFFGHREGARNSIRTVKACQELGVKALTLYCFSTENWKRPKAEVDYLMQKPVRYFERYKEELLKTKCKIQILGRKGVIPKALSDIFDFVEEQTKDNEGLVLSLCVDYGSYEELTTTFKKIGQMLLDNKITLDDITPELIENNLYTKGLPKLDLLIRTSGEQRISNFLLWQIAYAEFYFTDVYWPSFSKKELEKAIIDYQSRNRRYGGLKEEK